MKELSVFVDESGDFGEFEKHAPYYIITMVLHDQSVDISEQIWKLNETLKNMGYGNEQAIYTEPLIRREEPYRYFQNFNNIILYYDNGQHELNRILNKLRYISRHSRFQLKYIIIFKFSINKRLILNIASYSEIE